MHKSRFTCLSLFALLLCSLFVSSATFADDSTPSQDEIVHYWYEDTELNDHIWNFPAYWWEDNPEPDTGIIMTSTYKYIIATLQKESEKCMQQHLLWLSCLQNTSCLLQ